MHLPIEITNPETGERIVFDDDASTDDRLVWDEWRPANHDPPPVHHHPVTEERFLVEEGHLVVQVDGEDVHLDAGDEVVVPPGTPHVSFTEGDPAQFRRGVAPPGRWRAALTDRFAAVHALGDPTGVDGLLRTALFLRAYPDVVVPERPPRPVRRVLVPLLAAVARATGRTAHHAYPKRNSV